MNIAQFLKAAEECPDEKIVSNGSDNGDPRIKVDFGIYDNYKILLQGKPEKIKEILKKSESFIFEKTIDSSRPTHIFNYKPGIMYAQLFDGIWYGSWQDSYEQVKKDFDSTITLHPYQKKDMPDIKFSEVMSLGNKKCSTAIIRSIKDLASILEENKISFCLPSSGKTYSEMIKYFP